jgi:hypothetical protein
MRSISNFLRNDTGAVTIEFVVLVPFFVLMLLFFADISTVYLTRTMMWNTARDISRRMATREITNYDEVTDYVTSHLFLGNRQHTVSANFGSNKIVQIAVPIGNAAIFGVWLSPVMGETLTVIASMRSEPNNFVIGDPLPPA